MSQEVDKFVTVHPEQADIPVSHSQMPNKKEGTLGCWDNNHSTHLYIHLVSSPLYKSINILPRCALLSFLNPSPAAI